MREAHFRHSARPSRFFLDVYPRACFRQVDYLVGRMAEIGDKAQNQRPDSVPVSQHLSFRCEPELIRPFSLIASACPPAAFQDVMLAHLWVHSLLGTLPEDI